jgi:hypothetical protein
MNGSLSEIPRIFPPRVIGGKYDSMRSIDMQVQARASC